MSKKLLRTLLSLSVFTLPICNICFWIGGWTPWEDNIYKFPYGSEYTVTESDSTELQDKVDIGKEKEDKSIMIKLLEIFWFKTPAFNWDHKFIYYIKIILNLALWLLGFIALIMVIYTFYMMFFSKNDKSIEKAKWNLIGIFIALAIIWLARLIISFIFRRYQSNRKNKEADIGKWTVSNVWVFK